MINTADLSWEHGPDDDRVTPLEAIMLIKALDHNGELVIYERVTEGISTWEMLGIATTFCDGLRRTLLNTSEME